MTPILDRGAISEARRLVVKIGSSSLTLPDGGLDHVQIGALVDAVARRVRKGHRVVIVSSGSIAAGIHPLGLERRPKDLATQQAAASVGQGKLIAAYSEAFAAHGITSAQVLLTAEDLIRPQHYTNAQRALTKLLDLGVVPIVNENDAVATDEIRFGDNDRVAALTANLVSAEVLVLLSDVDGLYDRDPREAGAALVPVVEAVTPQVMAMASGASLATAPVALVATATAAPST